MSDEYPQRNESLNAQVDLACDALEAAWQRGDMPDWTQFVVGQSDQKKQKCCVELAAVDMEWRHRSGQRARAEDYLSQIPGQLSADLQVSIIAHEHEILQRSGKKSAPEGYFRRFPELIEALKTMFAEEPRRIEAENARKQTAAVPDANRIRKKTQRMAPTAEELMNQLSDSGLVSEKEVGELRVQAGLTDDNASGEALAKLLVKSGKLTIFQAQRVYNGNAKNLVMGSYVILDRLGAGGMGQVYKARHNRMKREVALKVLAPQYVKDESALQRFHREVEAAARLNHPNIVTAHDADESRGTHYLVMEYVRGDDLSKVVQNSGPLPITKAVSCVLQAARGLAFAHSQGVIHRDIKPSNLLLDETDSVKILDMGLARIEESDTDATAAALTGTGTLMGTVDYMAPEQAMDSKTADHRSDIYSLGCTLYFLITGQPMYVEDTVMKRIMAHQNAVIPQLPINDEALQSLFERMVAKKAEDRIEPAEELVVALESCQNQIGDNESVTRSDGAKTTDDQRETEQEPGLRNPSLTPGDSRLQAADILLRTDNEPVDDTSPTSSAFEATVVPSRTINPEQASQDFPLELSGSDVSKNKQQRNTKRSSSGIGQFANRKMLLAGAGGVAALILLGILTFRFSGKDGDVVVEVEGEVEIATIEIDGKQVSFTPAGTDNKLTFKAEPGEHRLAIKTSTGVDLTTPLGEKPLEVRVGETVTLRAWIEAPRIPVNPPAQTESKSLLIGKWRAFSHLLPPEGVNVEFLSSGLVEVRGSHRPSPSPTEQAQFKTVHTFEYSGPGAIPAAYPTQVAELRIANHGVAFDETNFLSLGNTPPGKLAISDGEHWYVKSRTRGMDTLWVERSVAKEQSTTGVTRLIDVLVLQKESVQIGRPLGNSESWLIGKFDVGEKEVWEFTADGWHFIWIGATSATKASPERWTYRPHRYSVQSSKTDSMAIRVWTTGEPPQLVASHAFSRNDSTIEVVPTKFRIEQRTRQVAYTVDADGHPESRTRTEIVEVKVPYKVDSVTLSSTSQGFSGWLNPPPDNDTATDRDIAEWVLHIGGEVEVVLDQQVKSIDVEQNLPDGSVTLISVNLERNEFVTDKTVRVLARAKQLKDLSLGYTAVSDKGLSGWIGTLANLNKLTLSHTEIGNRSLIPLGQLTQLRKLGLVNTAVTDEGLATIGQLNRLEDLQLGSTRTTDAGLSHLDKLNALRKLRVDETGVTEGGVAKLKAQLPKCDITWQPTGPVPRTAFIGEWQHGDGVRSTNLRIETDGKFSSYDIDALTGVGITRKSDGTWTVSEGTVKLQETSISGMKGKTLQRRTGHLQDGLMILDGKYFKKTSDGAVSGSLIAPLNQAPREQDMQQVSPQQQNQQQAPVRQIAPDQQTTQVAPPTQSKPRAELGTDERTELRSLLSQVIRVDASRTAQVNEIEAFLKTPESEVAWHKVQTLASKNLEKLKATIKRLEELNSEFIVDEIDTYRQLLIDLDAKAKVYENMLRIEDKELPLSETTDYIKKLAEEHNALIQKLQTHEAAIQKYLQTEK